MADLKPKLTVKWELTMTLTEDEAQALDAIVGYGADSFLKVFYEHMGKAYLEPYARGFRSLCAAIGEQLGPQLYELKEQRKGIEDGLRRAREERAARSAALTKRITEANAATALASSPGKGA